MSVIHTHNIYIVHIQAKRSEHKFSVFVHANNAVESNRAGPKVNPLSLLEVWINTDNHNLLKTFPNCTGLDNNMVSLYRTN